MEHLQKSTMGNWDLCYADIQHNQNSGTKSNQTEGISVLIDPSSRTRLAKKKKTLRAWQYHRRL